MSSDYPQLIVALSSFAAPVLAAIVLKRKLVWLVTAVCIGLLLGATGATFVSYVSAQTRPARTIDAPFLMASYFYPSGWMGDGEWGKKNLNVIAQHRSSNRAHDTDNACIRIEYRPGSRGWAGVYWQYPDGNWGEFPGTRVRDANSISFWARGESGGELVEFKAGGIRGNGLPYQDSFEKTNGPVSLTDQWVRYEIDLRECDLSHILGAFCCVFTKEGNPQGLVIFVDDIRYE